MVQRLSEIWGNLILEHGLMGWTKVRLFAWAPEPIYALSEILKGYIIQV